MLRGTSLLIVGLMGAAFFAQAPEFAQQYRQRLGGAVEELRRVVVQFDADAAQYGLSRGEAMRRYNNSTDGFFQTRGLSMNEVMSRYEHIDGQLSEMQSTGVLMRPLLVAKRPDDEIMRATWSEFRPAMPTTPEGGVYGLAGFFTARMAWSMILGLLGFGRRRRHA